MVQGSTSSGCRRDNLPATTKSESERKALQYSLRCATNQLPTDGVGPDRLPHLWRTSHSFRSEILTRSCCSQWYTGIADSVVSQDNLI